MPPHLFPAYARYRNERDNPKPLVAVAGAIVAAIVIIIVLAIIVMVASGAHSLRSPHEVRPFLLELSTTIGHPNGLDGVAAGKIQYRVTVFKEPSPFDRFHSAWFLAAKTFSSRRVVEKKE